MGHAAKLLREERLDLSELPEETYRQLWAELTSTLYTLDSAGRSKVESKDEMKKRRAAPPTSRTLPTSQCGAQSGRASASRERQGNHRGGLLLKLLRTAQVLDGAEQVLSGLRAAAAGERPERVVNQPPAPVGAVVAAVDVAGAVELQAARDSDAGKQREGVIEAGGERSQGADGIGGGGLRRRVRGEPLLSIVRTAHGDASSAWLSSHTPSGHR